MKHQEGFFDGFEKARTYYQCWMPEGEIKSVILIAHGLAEHSGRYMNLVNYFVPLGYAIYGLDHYGHGKSEGQMVYVKRFSHYIETLKIYFDMIRKWQPEKPIFLIGHSMGGLIAAAYLLKYQNELSGAILSGPGIKAPDNISSAVVYLGKVLSFITPKAGLIKLDANGVSRDRAIVEAYINDPWVYTGKITARLAAEMLKTMQSVTTNLSEITLPILIMQGGADSLVDPAGAQMLFDRVGSKDKNIKIYAGLYHEVFNEPEHAQVLGDVEKWLEARLNC
jgi:acylglycerol lipase